MTLHPVYFQLQACASDTAVFRLLRNSWRFVAAPTPPLGQCADATASAVVQSSPMTSCMVDFVVEYEFRNALYGQVQ